jgi:nucleotide-binding universal stress UspA family protein
MFDHILVPLRLGGSDERLIEPAIGLARMSQADVTVLHVVERVAGLPEGEVRGLHAQLLEKARESLEMAAKVISREGVPVATALLLGDTTEEIVRYANEHGVDLIVMGSHCVGARGAGLGWDTTSYRVGLVCQCPVFLVKGLETPAKTRRARSAGRAPAATPKESVARVREVRTEST